jgi:SAM-dependent methyltransferase
MMHELNTDMLAYYAQCVDTHDKIYAQPERQDDLAVLHERVNEVLHGHRVLEIACGTGYWTELIASVAVSVLATDMSPVMLARAKARNLPVDKVQFALKNAFALQLDQPFSACFAGCFWSHVKRQEQEGFLRKLHEKLGKDALLVMIDNSYVEEDDIPIARTDLEGNTHQIFTTGNGVRMKY